MAGGKETFREIPALSMSVLGLEVIFLGDISREHAEKIFVEGDETIGVVQRFLRGGKLVGATLVGRSKDRSTLTQEIAR
jgi:NAD(P)H-nitrite reductase large subunit